ncbi:MAG TPA: hypothetical protein VFA75_06380 [Nevskia sp.]|nr:hypothetical protein [Nevskia sp.]
MFRPFAFSSRRLAALAAPVVMALSLGLSAPAHATLDQSQVFPSWTPFVAGSNVTITGDTTAKHSGNVSLKFNIAATSPNNGGFSQIVTVLPSTKYHFSAWAKGSSSSGANHFVVVDSAGTIHQVGFAVGTSFWAQKNWDYTTSATDSQILVGFIAEGSGTFWFDDASFAIYGTTNNMLANPGFENWGDITVPYAADGNSVLNAFASGGQAEQLTTASKSTVTWTATDINGVSVGTGSVNTASGPASFYLPSVGAGWYSLHLTTPVSSADIPFTVTDTSKPTQPNAFGTNMHVLSSITSNYSLAEPKAVAAAGLGGDVRLDLQWSTIELSAGVYTWDPNVDAAVAAIEASGARPLMLLGYKNKLYDNNHVPSSSAGIAAYAAFAAAAAQHYGSGADYVVFNEFNGAGGNDSACGNSADCYYALLVPTSNAIHTAAPGARVLGPTEGGLTSQWIGTSPTSYTWLQRFLDLGGLAYVDVFDFHNYTVPPPLNPNGTYPPADPPEGNNDAVIAAVKSLVTSYAGGASKPLWLSETGWPTYLGLVSEPMQAQYLVRDAASSLRAGVSAYMYYNLMDDEPLAPDETVIGDGNYKFGLMRNPGTTGNALAPKPGYTAYSVLVHKLAGYTYASSDSWGSGVNSLVFTSGSASRRVAWAPAGNTTLAVTSSGNVTVTNWDGSSSTLSPVGGIVTFSVGPDPVYVDGSGITGGSIAGTAPLTATPPGTVTRNQPVAVAVAVNGSAPGAPVGAVTFSSPYGSTSLTAVAGTTVGGTLTLGGFPNTGTVTVPIQMQQGSTTVGRLVLTMNVTP